MIAFLTLIFIVIVSTSLAVIWTSEGGFKGWWCRRVGHRAVEVVRINAEALIRCDRCGMTDWEWDTSTTSADAWRGFQ